MERWKREYGAVCETIRHAEGKDYKKKRVMRQLRKHLKRYGELQYHMFNPKFRYNLCSARLSLGNFDNWDGWEFRSDFSMTFMEGSRLPIPKWDGSHVKHLVILGEQGIGDEILYASCIPELIVRLGHENIEYQTYPRLQKIFERSFKIRCTDRRTFREIKEGDALVLLSDLMMFYRRLPEHFPKKPFLKPNPERVEYWKTYLKDKPKPWCGYAYKSRHGNLNPKDFISDGTWINLQYGEETVSNSKEDMDDHIALVSCLDKVVTVTQTLVHECGAVGTECHAIRPIRGTGETDAQLWYYPVKGGSMPMYGSVTVYNSIGEYLGQKNIS